MARTEIVVDLQHHNLSMPAVQRPRKCKGTANNIHNRLKGPCHHRSRPPNDNGPGRDSQ